MANNIQSMVLIEFQEYKLLLKKAELYDSLISKTQKPQEGGSNSISQIIANQAFSEGLLKPSPKSSKNENKYFLNISLYNIS